MSEAHFIRMFKFNLTKTRIFQTVKRSRHPIFQFSSFLKNFFLTIFVIFFLLFLGGFLSNTLDNPSLSRLLGISVITLVLTIFFSLSESFFNSKLAKPRLDFSLGEAVKNPANFNLAVLLSFPVAKSIFNSIKWTKARKISEVDSTSLLYFIFKNNPKLNFIFYRVLLDPGHLKEILKRKLMEIAFNSKKTTVKKRDFPVFSECFQNSILEALKLASEKNHQRIEVGDMLPALAKYDPVFKKILIENKLKAKDIENLTSWLEFLEREAGERKKWWEYKNLIKKGSLGREFAAGYTVTLDQYSVDWSEILRKRRFLPVFGHKSELKRIERILSRSEINNVLLVGKPGTGKKAIVSQFAQKSLFGESLPNLNYKRIVELDLPTLISQIESFERVEAILDKIFKETVTAGNVVLVIPDIHNYIGGEAKPGVIDISGVLSSYLHLSQFQIIGTTNYVGLHENIEKKPSILNLFEKVVVSEISPSEALIVLESLVPALEKKYKRFISYLALRDIINYSDRYLPALPFPKKAQDVLDEAIILLQRSGEKVLMPVHITKVISEKSKIPIGEVEVKERGILLNLEKLIHERIINQDLAVKEVSAALRRARAEIKTRKGPMGSFLFLGPTGVGKTETSKALAEIYFGSEKKTLRFDMSEFQQIKDISRLIGTSDETGILTTKVRENPFALILLDEIEKAHPDILNLFLQVLDEGHLTDGLGRKVDFKHTIIIATSNAGYQIILESIAKKVEWSLVKKNLLDYLFEKGTFRPEFINRFDGTIVFNPLSRENLLDISQIQLQKLKDNLLKKDIELIITDSLKEKIVKLSYNPRFGAREMKRVIQNKIENVLAKALLGGEIKRGDRIEINHLTFQIVKV